MKLYTYIGKLKKRLRQDEKESQPPVFIAMTTINLTRLSRLAIRRRIKPTTSSSVVVVRPAASSSRIPLHPRPRPQLSQKAIVAVTSNCNYFSTSSHLTRPLDPDVLSRVKPNILPDSLYHELSDQYLDNLLYKLEAWQDERDDLDVEYSVSLAFLSLHPSFFSYFHSSRLPCPTFTYLL